MMRDRFDPPFESLPEIMPIFPLSGVLLLPGGRLPLNIFEPRYLAMMEDALKADRLIGLIQPFQDDAPQAGFSPNPDAQRPLVYNVGCAGRIISFAETEDGRYLITLSGLCRFRVRQELADHRGYRRIVPEWGPFQEDLSEIGDGHVDRAALLQNLQPYFQHVSIQANWEAVQKTPDERLVTSLAMICPFQPSEKQALLETASLSERARLMTMMMKFSIAQEQGDKDHGRALH